MHIKAAIGDCHAAYPTQTCEGCPIRYRAVCANCEADDLARLEDTKYYRTVKAGQVIFWAGDDMDFVASIIEGVATLTQTLEDGRTQMVGLLMPSDFLGRPGRRISAYTVTAISELQLCCFRRQPFEQMMRDNPRIPSRLLEMTLDELDAAREWMLLLGRKTAEEKVASFLLLIARRQQMVGCDRECAGQGDGSFALPLTRADMADYLGLTIETVSRQVTRLKLAGVIAMNSNRVLNIPSMARLAAAAGQPAAAN